MAEKQKKVRKYNVGKTTSQTMRTQASILSVDYMNVFNYKQTEGMSERTIRDYKSHFHYLMKFLDEDDISRNEMTKDLFREYISWMLYEQALSPVTVNVRLRTLRAFLRFSYKEGYIQHAIHEDLKILRTPQDMIESFTAEEIRKLLSVINIR